MYLLKYINYIQQKKGYERLYMKGYDKNKESSH